MRAADVRECAQIVANHPVIGLRYGRSSRVLEAAWLHLLGYEAKTAAVVEEGEGSRATICGVGVSLFVDDDFVRVLKTPPLRWIGPELAQRINRAEPPMLPAKRLRELNSRDGLNVVVWEGCIRPEFEDNGEAQRATMAGFIEQHRGFLWKENIGAQAVNGAYLEWMVRSGGLLWEPTTARYIDLSGLDPEEIARGPHIVGSARSMDCGRGRTWTGTWIGALFDYRAPRLGFGRAEQRLLLAALRGDSTDEDLAEALGVAVSTVKKMWLSVYRRASVDGGPIAPEASGDSRPARARGREKRRHLLSYLRDHPEELRPHSPKLLAQRSRRRQDEPDG